MKITLPITIPQAGAVPWRPRDGGGVEVLLVTTRGGKRWTIPKGFVDFSPGAREAAGKEAFEEAGVGGEVSPEPVGAYTHRKWLVRCRVSVYTLKVTEEFEDWPERGVRRREWVSPEEAVARVGRKALRKIIRAALSSLTGQHSQASGPNQSR